MSRLCSVFFILTAVLAYLRPECTVGVRVGEGHLIGGQKTFLSPHITASCIPVLIVSILIESHGVGARFVHLLSVIQRVLSRPCRLASVVRLVHRVLMFENHICIRKPMRNETRPCYRAVIPFVGLAHHVLRSAFVRKMLASVASLLTREPLCAIFPQSPPSR